MINYWLLSRDKQALMFAKELRAMAKNWLFVPDGWGRTSGICWHMDYFELDAYLQIQLKKWMSVWPESTGRLQYPVPHPYKDASKAFDDTWHMWNRWTRYGRARRRLALYLADRLEKEYK